MERVQVDEGSAALYKFTKAAEGAEVATSRLAATSKPAAGSVAGDMMKIESAASHSVPGLGKVERALGALAFSAAGIPGPVGSLATALLQLGVGGTVVIGLLAGFAAMTLAMKWFGAAAEEERDRLRGIMEQIDKLGESALRTATVLKLSAETALKDAEAKFAAVLGRGPTLWQKLSGVEGAAAFKAEVDAAAHAVMSWDAAVTTATANWDNELGVGTDAAKALGDAAKQSGDTASAAFSKAVDAADEFLAKLVKAAEVTDRWKMTFTDGLKDLQRLGLVGGPGTGTDTIEAENRARDQRLRNAGMLTDAIVKYVSDSEKTLIRDMQRDFAGLFDDLLTDGLSSFEKLFASIRSGFIKMISDLAAQKLMDKLTVTSKVTDQKTGLITTSTGLSGAGQAAGVLGVAFAVGSTITSVAERMLSAAALARKAAEEAARAWQQTIDAVNIGLMAPGLDKALAQSAANFQKLYDEAVQKHPIDFKHLVESTKAQQDAMDQVSALRDEEARQIREEYARRRAEQREDWQVRMARAQGHDAEADAMAFANAQHREYAQVVRDGATAAELAAFSELQLAEARRYAIAQATAAAEKEMQVHVALRDAFKQTTDTLRGYAASLRVTAGSPVQNYAEARKQFDDLAARARTGDQEAARQLPEFARQFLDLSRGYNASGMGYQNDFKYVMGIVDSLGDKFSVEQQLMQQLVDIDQKILDTLQGKRFSGEVPGGGGFGVYGGGTGAGEAGFGYQRPVQGTAPGGNTSPILFAGFTQMHDDMEELKVAMGTLATAVRRREAGPMVG